MILFIPYSVAKVTASVRMCLVFWHFTHHLTVLQHLIQEKNMVVFAARVVTINEKIQRINTTVPFLNIFVPL